MSDASYIETLRKLLSTRGITKKVSDETGIPYSTLANFKGRQTGLSAERIDRVARALGRRVMLVEDQ